MINNKITIFGQPDSTNIFIQIVDEHDLKLMKSEAEAIQEYTKKTDWCLVAVPVSSWNEDLTPWKAEPVIGKLGFGNGAAQTLYEMQQNVIPSLNLESTTGENRYYLCGYSLAGLFALWAAYQTDMFSGIVAASPSVWYPNWINYSKTHYIKANAVYLSLGDREEKTKNPVMSTVGSAIRELHGVLVADGINSCLEWNPGNHFVNSDKRTAKGIAWMLNDIKEEKPITE